MGLLFTLLKHYSKLSSFIRKDPLFWNITLDHYTIDSEAIIDYVLEQSKSETLGVFCFSVSCNSLHQLMAEHQRFNRLIRPLFQIAPFIFIHEIASLPLMINIGLEPIYRLAYTTAVLTKFILNHSLQKSSAVHT